MRTAEHDHDHDEFESFRRVAGTGRRPGSLHRRPDRADRQIHDILRLKGFADVAGKPMRQVIQAVGSRIDTHFDRPWAAGETRETRLVVIGLHDLDEAAIRDGLSRLSG
jgi:cobalamin biosynthesis protein CobW